MIFCLVYWQVVVIDRDAGFVTGGGWFDAPLGSFPADPSLLGKTTFSFKAQYKKKDGGIDPPIGNNQLKFKAAGLEFESKSMLDWLVVDASGSTTQFQGTGTIDGVNHTFRVWTSGENNDASIRIKIWNHEAVVFDNAPSEQPQDLGGGSIMIHTNKPKLRS